MIKKTFVLILGISTSLLTTFYFSGFPKDGASRTKSISVIKKQSYSRLERRDQIKIDNVKISTYEAVYRKNGGEYCFETGLLFLMSF